MLRMVRWGSHRSPRAGKSFVRSRHCRQTLGALLAAAVVLLAAAPRAEAACGRGTSYVQRVSLTFGVNQGALGGAPIRVTSSGRLFPPGNPGGQPRYDQIESAFFTVQPDIDLCYPGALDGFDVRLGACTGHRHGLVAHCSGLPVMFFESFGTVRNFSSERSFSFAIPVDSAEGQRILSKCNALADQARGAAQDVPAGGMTEFVTLAVDTRRDSGRVGRIFESDDPVGEFSKTEFVPFSFNIACAPLPQMSMAPPKITGAQLGVATFGDTCPKPAAATVMINAEAPRPVFYKIERGNGTTTTDDWIKGEIKLQKAPDGRQRPFLAAQHKLPALDPGTRKFRLWVDTWGKTPWRTVKVDCPPFEVVSAWLKYDVEDKDTCPKRVVETATFKATRPGQAPFEIKTAAGLVVHSGTAKFEREGKGYVAKVVRPNLMMNAFDSDMMADVKNQPDANSGWVRLKVDCLDAVSGKLTLRSLGATSCRGEALVAIHTSGAGELPYELECGPGRSWQRSVTAPANKIGVDKVQFDVKNNELVTCALRTRIGGKLKSLDGASRTFQCHRPSGVGGTDDLAPETRTEDPPPVGRTLAGDFSFIDNGGTRCPRQGKALINFTTNEPGNIHWSLDCTNGSFSGVIQAVKGGKGYVAPALVTFGIEKTTQVTCALKTVAPGKARVHKLKGHLFQCVRSTGVSGSDDLAPDGRPDPSGPRPPRIVTDPPRVCPANTVGRWPHCRPRPCPKGTVGTYPNCRRVDPPRCPPNTVGRPPNCRPRPCPKGTAGTYPNCRRVVAPKCPRGMVGRPPNCRPRPCPKGQVRVRGQCIRPAG